LGGRVYSRQESNPFLLICVNHPVKYIYLLLLLFLLGTKLVRAQSPEQIRLKEEIAYYADVAINAELDKHRIRANQTMLAILDSFLLTDGSFGVSLDSLPWISVLHGDDFRILSWQLKLSESEYKYGGLIQWADRIVRLKDTRPFINGSGYTTFTPAGWYGCLYYQIVPFERDKIRYYLLLGFNAENGLITTKIADILDLTGPEPRFGVPVFTGQGEARTRILFTYADVSAARMVYDSELNGIVHDHLESLPGIGPEGEALPVSDGSQEAWLFKKGDWEYKEEVYDVKLTEPPMTDDRKNFKEDKDILGRPRKD